MSFSNAPNIIVLLGFKGPQGVWRFLDYHEEYVGIPLKSARGSDLGCQIRNVVAHVDGHVGLESAITIKAKIDPLLVWNDKSKSLLILAECSKKPDLEKNWEVLPNILRRLPKNRNRIPFMKVFQHLSSLDEDCDALELTHELVETLFPPT